MLSVYERAILQYLRDECNGSAITKQIIIDVGISPITATKYLKSLEEKKYIVSRRVGKSKVRKTL